MSDFYQIINGRRAVEATPAADWVQELVDPYIFRADDYTAENAPSNAATSFNEAGHVSIMGMPCVLCQHGVCPNQPGPGQSDDGIPGPWDTIRSGKSVSQKFDSGTDTQDHTGSGNNQGSSVLNV